MQDVILKKFKELMRLPGETEIVEWTVGTGIGAAKESARDQRALVDKYKKMMVN